MRSEMHGILTARSGNSVRVQLLDPMGRPDWPTERRDLLQRYSDVAPAALLVPTLPAFVASKTATWFDRRAPRDLFDLCGLARLGAMTKEAADLFARLGPTGHDPTPWMFDHAPSADEWFAELAGQTHLELTPEEARAVVLTAWAEVLPW